MRSAYEQILRAILELRKAHDLSPLNDEIILAILRMEEMARREYEAEVTAHAVECLRMIKGDYYATANQKQKKP